MGSIDRKAREIVIEYIEYESMSLLFSCSSPRGLEIISRSAISPSALAGRAARFQLLLAESENEKTSFRIASSENAIREFLENFCFCFCNAALFETILIIS